MNEYNDQITTIATVRDVARLVGLSSARFYQLMQAGVFPFPVYNPYTRRPHFTEEQQRECLEVRRRNCGINGKPVLFYARRFGAAPPAARRPAVRKSSATGLKSEHAGLVQALKGLGLATVNSGLVTAAIKELFHDRVADKPESEVIRAVFLHLKRQSSADSVGG